jgi:hypothetical protein
MAQVADRREYSGRERQRPRQVPIAPMPTHTSVVPPPDDDGDAPVDGDGAGDPVGWVPESAGDGDAEEDGESPGELAPAPVGDAGLPVAEPAPDRVGEAEFLPALACAREPGPAPPDERFEDTSRAPEPRWPPAPPRPADGPAAGTDGAGATTAGTAAPAAGDEPAGELPPGRCTIRTDTDASTNSAISAAAASAGSRLPAGCSRITAAALRNACPVLLAPSATMSCGSGSAGPQPRLASWRSLRNAALRCLPVSPGSRYTVVRPLERSALPCNPGERSL